ncbi:cytochrome P450 [Crepidotus variabilis]|uniref:Cytochrome P450 n=1 Tax=Crepidotus variabilis TaxID=179855 RepID=A0A9P6JME0_9AGAR|nr:cytochrome P450 [Crepidotus variabilis]
MEYLTDSPFVGGLMVILVLSVGWIYACHRKTVTSHNRLPPGPSGLPFVGNAFQMPSHNQEKVFASWAKQYGNIVYLQILGTDMVVLNSLDAARDLLEKRGSIYSDRPRFVLLSEMMGWELASTHMRYGPRFRKHRRFINQFFNQKAVAGFRPLQEKEILILLEGMMHDPDRFVDHLRRYAAAVILKITYGHDICSVNDLFVKLAQRAATMTIESGSPAASLVDFFPALRHIPTWAPFSNFKIKAHETRRAVRDMMEIPFAQVKDSLRSGTAVPSYTSSLLESHRVRDGHIAHDDEEDIKGSAGTLFSVGIVPFTNPAQTVASIHTFLLAMLLYPKLLQKVQKEIDSVIGTARLPNVDDRASLPYLNCVLKEVIRWSPMVPLGMPHRLMEDDFYQGYFIPAGTTIVANIFEILRDCDQPDDFLPDRYLTNKSLVDPFEVVFGFGRRACPGRHLAESSYWLMAANIAATFDISKMLNDKGEDVNLTYGFEQFFVRHPKPFVCSIKPRSLDTVTLINHGKADLRS